MTENYSCSGGERETFFKYLFSNIKFLDHNSLLQLGHLLLDQFDSESSWLIDGLYDGYFESKSAESLELLLNTANISDSVYVDDLLNRIDNDLNPSMCLAKRRDSLLLLGYVIKNNPPWLHRISQHSIFANILNIIKNDEEITILINSVLNIMTLMSVIIVNVSSNLSMFFEGFSYLAEFKYKKDSFLSETESIHFQMCLYGYFHRLYRAYPTHFINYLSSFYSRSNNTVIFEEVVKPMLFTVRLHPSFVVKSMQEESTAVRWCSADLGSLSVKRNLTLGSSNHRAQFLPNFAFDDLVEMLGYQSENFQHLNQTQVDTNNCVTEFGIEATPESTPCSMLSSSNSFNKRIRPSSTVSRQLSLDLDLVSTSHETRSSLNSPAINSRPSLSSKIIQSVSPTKLRFFSLPMFSLSQPVPTTADNSSSRDTEKNSDKTFDKTQNIPLNSSLEHVTVSSPANSSHQTVSSACQLTAEDGTVGIISNEDDFNRCEDDEVTLLTAGSQMHSGDGNRLGGTRFITPHICGESGQTSRSVSCVSIAEELGDEDCSSPSQFDHLPYTKTRCVRRISVEAVQQFIRRIKDSMNSSRQGVKNPNFERKSIADDAFRTSYKRKRAMSLPNITNIRLSPVNKQDNRLEKGGISEQFYSFPTQFVSVNTAKDIQNKDAAKFAYEDLFPTALPEWFQETMASRVSSIESSPSNGRTDELLDYLVMNVRPISTHSKMLKTQSFDIASCETAEKLDEPENLDTKVEKNLSNSNVALEIERLQTEKYLLQSQLFHQQNQKSSLYSKNRRLLNQVRTLDKQNFELNAKCQLRKKEIKILRKFQTENIEERKKDKDRFFSFQQRIDDVLMEASRLDLLSKNLSFQVDAHEETIKSQRSDISRLREDLFKAESRASILNDLHEADQLAMQDVSALSRHHFQMSEFKCLYEDAIKSTVLFKAESEQQSIKINRLTAQLKVANSALATKTCEYESLLEQHESLLLKCEGKDMKLAEMKKNCSRMETYFQDSIQRSEKAFNEMVNANATLQTKISELFGQVYTSRVVSSGLPTSSEDIFGCGLYSSSPSNAYVAVSSRREIVQTSNIGEVGVGIKITRRDDDNLGLSTDQSAGSDENRVIVGNPSQENVLDSLFRRGLPIPFNPERVSSRQQTDDQASYTSPQTSDSLSDDQTASHIFDPNRSDVDNSEGTSEPLFSVSFNGNCDENLTKSGVE